jgi:hypothetical protein
MRIAATKNEKEKTEAETKKTQKSENSVTIFQQPRTDCHSSSIPDKTKINIYLLQARIIISRCRFTVNPFPIVPDRSIFVVFCALSMFLVHMPISLVQSTVFGCKSTGYNPGDVNGCETTMSKSRYGSMTKQLQESGRADTTRPKRTFSLPSHHSKHPSPIPLQAVTTRLSIRTQTRFVDMPSKPQCIDYRHYRYIGLGPRVVH